ncbi:MAG: Loki-CTERM sorting domain-containing protein [Promethearchaeota archaeon]
MEENGFYFKEIRISSLFIDNPTIPSYPLLMLFSIIAFISTIIIYRYKTVRTKIRF